MKLVAPLRRRAPALLASLLLSCGGGDSPTGGTPPSTQPAPQPTPTPTPTPVQTLCDRLGMVDPSRARCRQDDAGEFQADIDAAIDLLILEQGNLFENTSLGLRIRSVGAYYVGVIENLNEAGLCGGFDGEEVQVKSSNDESEQYDISSASGYVRRGPSTYRATCSPAAFPGAGPAPFPPPAGCNLPSSHEVACGFESARFLGHVEDAIDRITSEHPEHFDLGEIKQGTDRGYKIRNVQAYLDGVVANMQAIGYCARFDGEELVAKNSNTLSEHYDIITSDEYIRRGGGSYRVTCYPAAF